MEPAQGDHKVNGYQPVDNDDRDDEVELNHHAARIRDTLQHGCPAKEGLSDGGDLDEYSNTSGEYRFDIYIYIYIYIYIWMIL